jgi:hypothetical protein
MYVCTYVGTIEEKELINIYFLFIISNSLSKEFEIRSDHDLVAT